MERKEAIRNAYRLTGGNSFIDHVKEEVAEWEVVS